MKKLNWIDIIKGVLITLIAVIIIGIFTSGTRLSREVKENTSHRVGGAVELKEEVKSLAIKIDTFMVRQAKQQGIQEMILLELRKE